MPDAAAGCSADAAAQPRALPNPTRVTGIPWRAAQVAPLAIFWWLYVISGVTALRYLNVPMYRWVWPREGSSHGRAAQTGQGRPTQRCRRSPAPRTERCRPPPARPRSVIRRSTTLLVVAGEYQMFNKRPTNRSLAALLLMVGGAVVAGLTDLTTCRVRC